MSWEYEIKPSKLDPFQSSLNMLAYRLGSTINPDSQYKKPMGQATSSMPDIDKIVAEMFPQELYRPPEPTPDFLTLEDFMRNPDPKIQYPPQQE